MDELPRILGKFNYMSTKPDLYDILYVPYIGAGCVMIARNLSFELMTKMKEELNGTLHDFREDIRIEAAKRESGDV